MNRTIALILIVIILLVGCQNELKPSEMDPNDLPDERAFQDEFTRGFLQSVEETRPGYYPFLSKTGKYNMDFPASGVISKNFYSIKNNSYENLGAAMLLEGVGSHISIIYYGNNSIGEIDSHLDFFQGRIGESTTFEKIKNKNRFIYYSYMELQGINNHVAYIQNINSIGGIEIIVNTKSEEFNQLSNSDRENRISEIKNWIKSIQFINGGKD